MTVLPWVIAGVFGFGLVLVLVQFADLRTKMSEIPTGDDELLGMVRRLDNEIGALGARISGLDQRLSTLEGVFPTTIRHSAVYSYDGFPGMVGSLSRSIAMLDERGDGFVMTVLVNREESRFFLKQVSAGGGVEPLSPEETKAIAQALGH